MADSEAKIPNHPADTERMTDYERRYHFDPVFHAQVHVGAQALIERWQRESRLNQSPTDQMWADAKLLAFTVLKAVGEADA